MSGTVTEISGLILYRGSAAGNWGVTVPVPETEQRTEICDGPEHKNKPFTATGLRTFPGWADNGTIIRYLVAGPNIRQDGTPGAHSLSCWISREYAARTYPAALALMIQAGRHLQDVIRAEAETAVTQIGQVLQSNSEQEKMT